MIISLSFSLLKSHFSQADIAEQRDSIHVWLLTFFRRIKKWLEEQRFPDLTIRCADLGIPFV